MPTSNSSLKRMSDKFEKFPSLNPTAKPLGPFPAKVHTVTSHVIFFTFNIWDKPHMAYAIPGRLYVNGRENLLKYGKSPQLLAAILNKNLDFKITVRELTEARRGYLNTKSEEEASSEKLEKKKTGEGAKEIQEGLVSVTHYVTFVSPIDYNDKFVANGLNNAGKFHNEEHSFSKYFEMIQRELLDAPTDGGMELNWFCVNELGETGYTLKPPADPVEVEKGVTCRVKEIHRPFGGVLEASKKNLGPIIFYRMSVRVNGNMIGFTSVLDDNLKVGDTVVCNIARNQLNDGSECIGGIKGHYYASEVHKGTKVDSPPPRAKPPRSCPDESHKMQIFQLNEDPSGSGAYTSGLAVVQMSGLIKSEHASANMVGEFCKFSNKDIYFMGACMEGKDLSYFLKPGDAIYGQLAMLPVKEQRAQYVVKVAYYGKYEPHPYIAPESAVVHRHLGKRFADFATLEKIILQNTPPRVKTLPPGIAYGRLHNLEPAENKETVSKGTIRIVTGPHKGSTVKMNRGKISIFGISLEGCDLLYCLQPHEDMFCEVGGIGDYDEGQYVSQYCTMVYPERKVCSNEDPMNLSSEDRTDFLAWLHSRGIDYPMFKRVKAKTAPFKYFIPFPKDTPLTGRVVSLDPVRPKHGASAGTIIVDSGLMNVENPAVGALGVKDMKGVKVTFHRANFWVFGRKMAKADLTYLIKPNQRVMLECSKITAQERELYPNLPPNMEYRATIVWVGPTRPRNDRDDPNRNDVSIFDWLSKRGLNIQQFNKLVDGTMTAHTPMELDHRNFFLPPEKGSGAIADSEIADLGNSPETMPVLRHGPVIAHILDTAITCTGPTDPRLYHLLENDNMAQAAHHVSEALKFAIRFYREKSSGLGGGYGPRGPGAMAPKRAFESFRGGPNKKARGGYGFH